MPRRLFSAAPLLAALFVGLALAAPARAEEPAPRTITISGEGEATAVPDIAYIDTGVVTEGATAAEALAANTKAMAAVFKGLEDAGIEKRMPESWFEPRLTTRSRMPPRASRLRTLTVNWFCTR